MANTFTITGEFGGTVEGKVLKFVVSTPERRKDKETGEWETRQMPVQFTVFGELASAVSRLTRGSHVAVIGTVSGRTYEGKVYSELIAREVIAVPNAEADEEATDEPADDIPF
jgi:single-stranded DNA-binding protein